MPKAEKVEKVTELKARIEASEALFLADFRGLTVGESGELRRSLSDAGTRFSVVKNTLMKLAAADAGAAELERLLEGPTAVAFVRADPVGAAKQLVDAGRRFRTLVLKGAWLEGRVLTPEEAQSLATIESREVLLAKMAGLAKADMSRAAYLFKALQSRFFGLLQAYRDKLPAEAAEEPTDEETAQTEQETAEAVEEALEAVDEAAAAVDEGNEAVDEATEAVEQEAEEPASEEKEEE